MLSKFFFNADETGKNYTAQEAKSKPGYKSSKDRLILLLSENAAGDVKFTPLLVYIWKTKRYCKALLPVVWKSSHKRLGLNIICVKCQGLPQKKQFCM